MKGSVYVFLQCCGVNTELNEKASFQQNDFLKLAMGKRGVGKENSP